MRDKKVFLLMVLFLVCSGVNAFAVLDDNTNEGTTAGESIRLTDGLATPNTLVLNFSPSVNGMYLATTEGTAGNRQWYSVATYHSGGQLFFASSSDSTGVYKQDRDADQVFNDVTIPNSSEMTVPDGSGGEEQQSAEEYWLDNDWEK